MQPAEVNVVTGCRRNSSNIRPVDRYALTCRNKLVVDLADTDKKRNPGMTTGIFEGKPCGPFLKQFSEADMIFAVVGPNAELSEGMRRFIALLVGSIAPEAVRVWRLEGESGARVQTKATISYIVRRRLSGASWRGIASHVINRLWFVGGGAETPSNSGNGPRKGFADGAGGVGDQFDDPFSQFAGRGSWSGDGFDATRL